MSKRLDRVYISRHGTSLSDTQPRFSFTRLSFWNLKRKAKAKPSVETTRNCVSVLTRSILYRLATIHPWSGYHFCNHFLCLCEWLLDTYDIENANANVKRVDTMLLKKFKRCFQIMIRMLLQFFPFISKTMSKLK